MKKPSRKPAAKNRTTGFMRALQKELELICPAFNWRGPCRPEEIKGDARCVDLIGRPRESGSLPMILIEVELRRRSTVKNVVKVWQWADHGFRPGRFILVQAFSAFYATKAGRGDRADAVFVGKAMATALGDRCCYECEFKFPYRPKEHSKKGGGARDKQAVKFAAEVQGVLDRERATAAAAGA
ncbi:MAG: hypothetical protein ACTHJX_10220 [Terriglobales bacterium]